MSRAIIIQINLKRNGTKCYIAFSLVIILMLHLVAASSEVQFTSSSVKVLRCEI